MKRNRISKNQAARAIAHAVRNGWNRRVDVSRNLQNQPRCIIVQLGKAKGSEWAQLFVNFVKHIATARWSVQLHSQCNYHHKLVQGRSEFGYQLSRMNSEAA